MLPSYVMLDLETTGGNPVSDRIIEIAVVRIEEGREVARWSTLVNPGRWVSPFITSLTGIDHTMVADAPRFEALAPRLLELLDGTVLVAHNVRFDHGFLKNAFQRIDIDLRVRLLCTVRLSRKLYPQHKGHGLDAILRRHGLHSTARHRAMGDVDAVLDFLALEDWPSAGRIGLREHDPHTGRTDIHVFDHWCHLATVHDESELNEALDTRSALAFDVGTYQLLRKRLLAAQRTSDRGWLHLDDARASGRRLSA